MKRMNFPGNKEARKEKADERNEAWQKLTPKQQLEALDERFGKDKGARKQRSRLISLIKHGKNLAGASTSNEPESTGEKSDTEENTSNEDATS